jgi:DUF1680 family protein
MINSRPSPFRVIALAAVGGVCAWADPAPVNLAPFATPATSFVSGHESLGAINDGYEPKGQGDHSHGAYGNWPQTGAQWVELAWDEPIQTRQVDVYWWADGQGVRLPVACRLLHWDGGKFAPVADAAGLGVAGGRYNTTTFAAVTTTRLRLEFDGEGKFSTGIIEWKVLDAGGSPRFAPKVLAGPDRVVVPPAATHLRGELHGTATSFAWSKASGPGRVDIGQPEALETEARFSKPGEYRLRLTAANGARSAADEIVVRVDPSPPGAHLSRVPMRPYRIDSPLWSARLKQVVVNWIPHCIAKLSEPGLKEGGIENFVEAGHKLAGRPHKPHVGAPWANAYTFNTVESMCLALMVDAGGDAETVAAQAAIREKLEAWIPLLLAAQEPDGYLQTRFTLGMPGEQKKAPPRWTYVADHEGYLAGYFIDAAVAHFRMSGGQDRRMYEGAKRLADCWDKNIGPAPKRKWFDGHQALEMALVRLAQLVDEVEGDGFAGAPMLEGGAPATPEHGPDMTRARRYVHLARFLLDSRGGGSSYDQSHLPVVQQYEALGHAVRAAYTYAAMTDIAMETGDPAYHSAVKSIWDNVVNRKYYITGGIGSGETSEGFGADYSLPNHAYSESCYDYGQLFFQHRMNLAYGEARYADLMEETLFNAVLGSLDLPARNFTYTNPLDQEFARYPWHGCPCCIGNIPRTLLMLPEWMYAKSGDGLYVNLYAGGTVQVGPVAGREVELAQRTDYPWKGRAELIVNPAEPVRFTLFLRAPDRDVSALYRATPDADGIAALAVNGKAMKTTAVNGYVAIRRTWTAGDTVTLDLPLQVQRVTCDERVVANRGRVALRCGPLVYNIESVDQSIEAALGPDAELAAGWEPDLLGGVVAIRGRFANGKPLLAIPNYARNNRGGRSVVWIRDAAR